MAHGRSHYIKTLWNVTFGLWKITIMNGFIWMENKQTSQKQGTCRNFDLIMRVSVDNFFLPSINLLKILWRSYCEKITVTQFINCSNVIFTIFGNFSQQAPILCVFLAEINIPKEISSAYSSVMCSAIQVFHDIVMLIARFPWLFAKCKRCSI